MSIPREFHVDGGAFVEPPQYRFHDAYFSVLDSNGTLIHFEKNIGDVWSGVAEYEAIRWAVENISQRPIKIFSDCTTAIAWAKRGANTEKHKLPPLNLSMVELEWKHENLADVWNARNHSPKKSKSYYIKRYDTFPKEHGNGTLNGQSLRKET